MLAAFPLSGSPRPDIGPSYRSVPSLAHIIFYHAVANGIRVVRVRPARMDPARHLLPDPWEYL
jgi:plasmid stabilization system protein ParE